MLLAFRLLSALLLAWLLWMLYKFKHEIDDEYLWLRYAREFECRIPLNAIESVTQGMTSRSSNKTRSVVDGTLVVEISNSTKIEFWADDPDEMVRALRK